MWQGIRRTARLTILLSLVTTPLAGTAAAAFTQQGDKMTAAVSGSAKLGQSVSISRDGDRVVVGAPGDAGVGSAWVFERSGTTWDSGAKLPIPAAGMSEAGNSVAISADGSTVVVGGPSGARKAWVFTKPSGAWELAATLAEPAPADLQAFGWSVGVSGDGGRIIVGGASPSYNQGRAWVFARSGSSWAPEGVLEDPAADSDATQGWSVAISEDGSTAIVGGTGEGDYVGAAWVYAASGATWSLQQKLGGFSTPLGFAGTSVALSANGSVAMVGAPFEGVFGTARVYRRTSGVWDATGTPLIKSQLPSGASQGSQGSAVSLSGDGQIALVGEPTLDFSVRVGRGLVYEAVGGVWPISAEELVGTGGLPATEPWSGQGWSVALSGDGNTSVLGALNDNVGAGAIWIFTRDTSDWVSIATPCPELYLLGKSYGFSANVNVTTGGPVPTFSWSLSPSRAAEISGSTTGNTVTVDMKPTNPAIVLGPGPFAADLCVDVTIGTQVAHECVPIRIYRSTSDAVLLRTILSLDCRTIEPVRSKPPGFFDRWRHLGVAPVFSPRDISRLESFVKQLSIDLKAVKTPGRVEKRAASR